MKKALLALQDGTVFEGFSFGAEGEIWGEVVFNTSLTGYQEILTDPSYRGQIVTMTYTHIGNYGTNIQDIEARKPFLSGFIVRERTDQPSNWRAEKDLDTYLKENGIVGIEGIDTRALTRILRDWGSQMGIISTINLDPWSLARKAKDLPSIVGKDLVREVTCEKPYEWTEKEIDIYGLSLSEPGNKKYHVVVYDFGVKRNILRILVSNGCKVTVVPASTPAEDVLSLNPDGILLSNGPGDPSAVSYAIENTRKLIGKKPIFGICLGHQIIALALGGRTFKLRFGHHGGNQPVKDLATGKVEITAQNHNFAVDIESLGGEMEVTHINLNDHTLEGMRHKEYPLFSVQYHPEASPGPHDSRYLFGRFINLMKEYASKERLT